MTEPRRKVRRRVPAPPKESEARQPPPPTESQRRAQDQFREIAQDARSLLRWVQEKPRMKKILVPSLWAQLEVIRYTALRVGGYDAENGRDYDVYRARHLFITGTLPSPTERCAAITRMGTRCKNRPMIGEEHCGVPGHATRDELERVHQNATKWAKHFAELLSAVGLTDEYAELLAVVGKEEVKK